MQVVAQPHVSLQALFDLRWLLDHSEALPKQRGPLEDRLPDEKGGASNAQEMPNEMGCSGKAIRSAGVDTAVDIAFGRAAREGDEVVVADVASNLARSGDKRGGAQ
jgi:hypothetical protein